MKFWWKGKDLLSDSASAGFMRMLGKNWAGLKHDTAEERATNWNFAKRVARLEAGTWLVDECQRPEVAISQLVPEGLTTEQEQDFIDSIFGEDSSMSVAAISVDRDLRERAGYVLADLASTPHWGRWLEEMVSGVTEEAAAKRHGVTQVAVHLRRTRGLNSPQVRAVLVAHGLSKEPITTCAPSTTAPPRKLTPPTKRTSRSAGGTPR